MQRSYDMQRLLLANRRLIEACKAVSNHVVMSDNLNRQLNEAIQEGEAANVPTPDGSNPTPSGGNNA